MYKFEDIHLTSGEKLSLFSFHFKKRQRKERIKHFQKLCYDFEFLRRNLKDDRDSYGNRVLDDTCSISDRYCRFKIWRRKQRLKILPNWIAILISFATFVFTVVMQLWQLGYI